MSSLFYGNDAGARLAGLRTCDSNHVWRIIRMNRFPNEVVQDVQSYDPKPPYARIVAEFGVCALSGKPDRT